jgi:hypothetical protein
MPGNYPEENIQHSQHGESLKSRIPELIVTMCHPLLLELCSSYILKYTVICPYLHGSKIYFLVSVHILKLFVGTNISVLLKWKGTAHIYKMSVCGAERQKVMGGLEKLYDEELQKCVCRLESAGLV